MGWRRVFCTTIPQESLPRDHHREQQANHHTPSPRFLVRLFSSSSSSSGSGNHATPRLTCRINDASSPVSTQSSPNTPTTSRFFIFRSTSSKSSNLLQSQTLDQITHRSYNDDESLLLSPTMAGLRFNTIPEEYEAEEEGNAKVETNRSHSSSSKKELKQINGPDSIELRLVQEVAVISVSKTHETYAAALKIKTPTSARLKAESASRAPVDIVVVLDVGSNMNGAKLLMMKRAMRLIIGSSGSADRLSIVASTPKRLMNLRRMTAEGKQSARRLIDRLGCSGTSVFRDALRKATRVLEDRRETNPVSCIVILSDGQKDKILKNQQLRCTSLIVRLSFIEISVSEFGFGSRGGYAREPAEVAFRKYIDGVLEVVVHELRLKIGTSTGEISAIYSCNGRPKYLGSSATPIKLGDLYGEEERELLVEFRVVNANVGSQHAMVIKYSYKDHGSRAKSLDIPTPQMVRSSTTRIERLRNFFITTRAIAESRRLQDHNHNLSTAFRMLSSTRVLLVQSGSSSANEFIHGLDIELAELNYKRQRLEQGRRTVPKDFVESLTPTSAWRAAERLAKLAIKRKAMNRVSDLHGFENAGF